MDEIWGQTGRSPNLAAEKSGSVPSVPGLSRPRFIPRFIPVMITQFCGGDKVGCHMGIVEKGAGPSFPRFNARGCPALSLQRTQGQGRGNLVEEFVAKGRASPRFIARGTFLRSA
jgi:hypothetical protein